jgi:hypothetical protein
MPSIVRTDRSAPNQTSRTLVVGRTTQRLLDRTGDDLHTDGVEVAGKVGGRGRDVEGEVWCGERESGSGEGPGWDGRAFFRCCCRKEQPRGGIDGPGSAGAGQGTGSKLVAACFTNEGAGTALPCCKASLWRGTPLRRDARCERCRVFLSEPPREGLCHVWTTRRRCMGLPTSLLPRTSLGS